MIRNLAPAGHKIYFSEIIRSLYSSIIKKNTPCNPLHDFFSDKEIFYVNHGTAALYYLLSRLKAQSSRTEVIIPAYTCPTVAAAVIKANLKPVTCEISADDFSLDTNDLKYKTNKHTLGIIQVELFGILSDNSDVKKIAKEKGIYLIGDTAQSFGNYLLNSSLLNSQRYDFIIFSLGRGKPLNLLHGGGIVDTSFKLDKSNENNVPIFELTKIEGLKSIINVVMFKIFFNPYFYTIPKLLPFLKLGETIFSLDIRLKKISKFNLCLFTELIKRYPYIYQNRLKIVDTYRNLVLNFSSDLYPLKIEKKYDLIRFPILFKSSAKRDLIQKELDNAGMGATTLYPNPLHLQPGLESYKLDKCQNATNISRRILTLPIHEYVTMKDIKKISDIFFNKLGEK